MDIFHVYAEIFMLNSEKSSFLSYFHRFLRKNQPKPPIFRPNLFRFQILSEHFEKCICNFNFLFCNPPSCDTEKLHINIFGKKVQIGTNKKSKKIKSAFWKPYRCSRNTVEGIKLWKKEKIKLFLPKNYLWNKATVRTDSQIGRRKVV